MCVTYEVSDVNVKGFYDLNNSESNLAVDRDCVTSQ